jgi:CheY-like chemotaxis protein
MSLSPGYPPDSLGVPFSKKTPYNILIVEDELIFRRSITLILRLENYDVRSVPDGKEALQAMLDHPPDLVILDLNMPRCSGWDVIRSMRGIPALQQTPILLLTASADESTRQRALAERVNDLLIKPVGIQEILQAVQKVIPTP